MARKLLAARADLVEEISKLARSRNQTIYGLVNSILEQALKVYRMNLKLEDIVDSYMILRNLKNLGFIPLPEDVAYKALDQIFNDEPKETVDLGLRLGEWYGRVLEAQLPDLKPPDMLRMIIREVAWAASEVAVLKNGDQLIVRCIGPRFSRSYTELLARMAEGVALSMGFKTVQRYVARGVILLTLRREKSLRSGEPDRLV
ncbi:MAG: hypothetical protein AYL29_006170 [Candidatus Bathyarchaeota archaeon B24]|nr:MAG: hypothetical protein AYL29_006170 [Candidatus Bathyarchaeota archaeon B24]